MILSYLSIGAVVVIFLCFVTLSTDLKIRYFFPFRKMTPLHVAAGSGFLDIVTLLIKNGAEVKFFLIIIIVCRINVKINEMVSYPIRFSLTNVTLKVQQVYFRINILKSNFQVIFDRLKLFE